VRATRTFPPSPPAPACMPPRRGCGSGSAFLPEADLALPPNSSAEAARYDARREAARAVHPLGCGTLGGLRQLAATPLWPGVGHWALSVQGGPAPRPALRPRADFRATRSRTDTQLRRSQRHLRFEQASWVRTTALCPGGQRSPHQIASSGWLYLAPMRRWRIASWSPACRRDPGATLPRGRGRGVTSSSASTDGPARLGPSWQAGVVVRSGARAAPRSSEWSGRSPVGNISAWPGRRLATGRERLGRRDRPTITG
jgi:hypothetical protein